MLAFKVFLSHRYKSPEVNLFFFTLFSRTSAAELQFEVDGWNSETHALETKPTNVTRLERMVRGAHAFVGIYPFPGSVTTAPTMEALTAESRYFRLELDLAVRARKPALVCVDQRYRTLLRCPRDFHVCEFDPLEILGGGAAPSAPQFEETFRSFCKTVDASMSLSNTKPRHASELKVGVLLKPEEGTGTGYTRHQVERITALIAGTGSEVVSFPWPAVLNSRLQLDLLQLDWIVLDVGDDPPSAAVTAYTHGRFIPTLRLRHLGPHDADAAMAIVEQTLYGGHDAGFPKDILRWRTDDELERGLVARLSRIDEPPFRISTQAQADDYFRTAARRKEALFLSYSGGDAELGARISAALRKRFQDVFDYRDGHSIRAGQPWLKEIFDKLSRAAVAVPLLSKSYAESGNCLHEAEEIVALKDSNKLQMIPVNIATEALNPEQLSNLSFLRSSQYVSFAALNRDPDALAQQIVEWVKAQSG